MSSPRDHALALIHSCAVARDEVRGLRASIRELEEKASEKERNLAAFVPALEAMGAIVEGDDDATREWNAAIGERGLDDVEILSDEEQGALLRRLTEAGLRIAKSTSKVAFDFGRDAPLHPMAIDCNDVDLDGFIRALRDEMPSTFVVVDASTEPAEGDDGNPTADDSAESSELPPQDDASDDGNPTADDSAASHADPEAPARMDREALIDRAGRMRADRMTWDEVMDKLGVSMAEARSLVATYNGRKGQAMRRAAKGEPPKAVAYHKSPSVGRSDQSPRDLAPAPTITQSPRYQEGRIDELQGLALRSPIPASLRGCVEMLGQLGERDARGQIAKHLRIGPAELTDLIEANGGSGSQIKAAQKCVEAAKAECCRRKEARGLKTWRVWWVYNEAQGWTVYARTRSAARWDALRRVDRENIPRALREIRVQRAA